MVHHLLKVLYTTGGVCRHSGGTSSVLLAPVPCSTCISNALPSLHTQMVGQTGWLVATIWVFTAEVVFAGVLMFFGPIRSCGHNIGHVIAIWVWQGHVIGGNASKTKSKWPPAKFQCFQIYLTKFTIIAGIYHKYCWIMLYLCQIEDCTSITAGGKAS